MYVKYSPLIERFPRIGSKCPKILYIKMMEDILEINVLVVILVHIVFVHMVMLSPSIVRVFLTLFYVAPEYHI